MQRLYCIALQYYCENVNSSFIFRQNFPLINPLIGHQQHSDTKKIYSLKDFSRIRSSCKILLKFLRMESITVAKLKSHVTKKFTCRNFLLGTFSRSFHSCVHPKKVFSIKINHRIEFLRPFPRLESGVSNQKIFGHN